MTERYYKTQTGQTAIVPVSESQVTGLAMIQLSILDDFARDCGARRVGIIEKKAFNEQFEPDEVKKRVYLSGPITGTEDFMERFTAAEQRLTAAGYEVINPAKVSSALPELTHGEYMAICRAMLPMCSEIYMLMNCEWSAGAMEELSIATRLGLKVRYEEHEIDPEPEGSYCG